MKPAKMTKISITGHKDQLQETIETLYNLELLDISRYDGDLETGNPFENAEELSQLLVETRSILSKLPEVESEDSDFRLSKLQENLNEIGSALEKHNSEISEIETEIDLLESQLEVLNKIRGCGLEVMDVRGTERLNTEIVDVNAKKFEDLIETDNYNIFEGDSLNVIVFDSEIEDEVNEILKELDAERFQKPLVDAEGSIEEAIETVKSKIKSLEAELDSKNSELEEKAGKWRGNLEQAEEFLNEKVAKAEAPLDFAMTDHAFIAEGWIPDEEFQELGTELHRATDGHIHMQTEVTDEEPPTKHENNNIVQPFESLTDLVSVPKHNELDPSVVLLLTFPLFFGFMIGDAGYGLTTMAVFYGGYKLVPQAADIFKSLMFASLATIIFGLAFGDAFGYVIFGHHSELAAVTGIHFFEQIPILFHRAEHLGDVFTISAIIGLVHVNLGYLIGFYNEFARHGLKEAFLEKISWILLEIGAFAWFVFGGSVGGPILVIAVFMLYVGEGVEGVVEIPSLLSNILSYLRIFGVSVAAVALAAVVNAMADPLFQMNSPVGFALGTTVLVVGHVFNTFIKIMEGFLQGIRLHYVEMFSKFYEGGGRKYVPFGSK